MILFVRYAGALDLAVQRFEVVYVSAYIRRRVGDSCFLLSKSTSCHVRIIIIIWSPVTQYLSGLYDSGVWMVQRPIDFHIPVR